MNSIYPRTVVVDTGFWFALLTPADRYHSQASDRISYLEKNNVLIPWPSLYETIDTRLCKNRLGVIQFETYLKKPHFILFDDTKYRDEALEETIKEAIRGKRSISLVDMIIRYILDDRNVRTNFLLTINEKDFSDICRKRNITIL